jgi:PKD repeat protein
MATRTNYAPNPRFVNLTNGGISTYGSGTKTVSTEKTFANGTTTSLKVMGDNNGTSSMDGGTFNEFALPIGTYKASVDIITEGNPTNVHFVIRNFDLLVQTHDAGNTTGKRLEITFTVTTAGSYNFLLGLGSYASPSVGTVWFSNFLVEQTSTAGNAFFDGASTKSGFSYAWTGVANNSTSTETTVVQNIPPVANFTASTTTPYANAPLTFTDTSTNFPTSWLWSFGDGTTSTVQNPTKTYTTAGTYSVTLTATNPSGTDDEVKTNYITVSPPAQNVLFVKSDHSTIQGYVQSGQATIANVVAGNFLIAVIAAGPAAADFGTLSDDKGNTWVKMDSSEVGGKGLTVWYAANAKAGTTLITVTGNAGGYLDFSITVREYTNVDSTNPIIGFVKAGSAEYINYAEATITPSYLSSALVLLAGNGSGPNVASPGTNETNVTNAPNGSYSNTHSAGKPFTALTPTTGRLGYTEYTTGTIWIVELKYSSQVVVAPIDPTEKVVTPKDWHPFGFKPNKTTAQLRSIARTKYDLWFGFTLATDGMPSGMPSGAKRIKVPDQGFYQNPDFGGTVSEGMGYGMLIKAWFSHSSLGAGVYDPNARADFDALFKYMKFYKNSNGLMNWNIKNTGAVADTGGATDGDLDIAMSLVIMSRLWTSDGPVNYAQEATTYINAIMNYEFVPATGVPGTNAYPNIMTNGDGWGFATNNMMPDYFRAGFMREFYYHTNNSRWLDIINANYTYMLKYYYDNYTGGMVPDRQTRESTSLGADTDMVTYNSVRLGFSVMYDYLWNGSTAPVLGINMMNKMADKAKSNFTTGGNVKAPNYNLNFTTWQSYSNLSGHGLIGPATLGKAENQTFATEMVDYMSTSNEFGSSYFNGGVGLMGLMAMSGMGQNYRTTSTTDPDSALTQLIYRNRFFFM